MDKDLKKDVYKLLQPLYGIIDAVDMLMNENRALEEENKRLKERLDWHEKSLEENAKASGEAMHHFITACLDGRIKIENNKTIIEQS